MKTKIYNLIILDESGSMSCYRSQTINGCNETINTIKSAQTKYADTQEHYVSIYAFQSNTENPSHYLIKNAPADSVSHINEELYRPWGGTPLYDAVGSTLADLKASMAAEKEVAIGSVTIITDGEENSSRCYTRERVSGMICLLKELGWNFNFIGANIDVKRAAESMSIDNSMEFQQTKEGTEEMFRRERSSRMAYYGRTSRVMEEMACESARADYEADVRSRLKDASADYFEQSDEDDKA